MKFKVGDKVVHEKFGYYGKGEVISISSDGDDNKRPVEIKWENIGHTTHYTQKGKQRDSAIRLITPLEELL